MPPAFDHSRGQTARARRLRRDMTDIEKKLWWRLRSEQLEFPFRRQHPIGPFVLDFFCAPALLAIELDGDRHFTDEAIARDAQRTAFLEAKGIRVMRFANHEIRENIEGVVETIWNELQQLTPTPTLPLAGGGSDGEPH